MSTQLHVTIRPTGTAPAPHARMGGIGRNHPTIFISDSPIYPATVDIFLEGHADAASWCRQFALELTTLAGQIDHRGAA